MIVDSYFCNRLIIGMLKKMPGILLLKKNMDG